MMESASNKLESKSDIARLTVLCIRAIANFYMQIPKKQIQFIPTKFKGKNVYVVGDIQDRFSTT